MKEKILETVENSEKPLSANQIAEKTDVEWHTAKKYLEQLLEEKQIHKKQISNRLTLYNNKKIHF